MNTLGKAIASIGFVFVFGCWITALHPYVQGAWATWYGLMGLFTIPVFVAITEFWGNK